jgi:hypothetical protein
MKNTAMRKQIIADEGYEITKHNIVGGGITYGVYWRADGMHTVGFVSAKEAHNNAKRFIEMYGSK